MTKIIDYLYPVSNSLNSRNRVCIGSGVIDRPILCIYSRNNQKKTNKNINN